jgi:hypothetical protein
LKRSGFLPTILPYAANQANQPIFLNQGHLFSGTAIYHPPSPGQIPFDFCRSQLIECRDVLSDETRREPLIDWRKELRMRRIGLLAFAFFLLFGHSSIEAMGDKKTLPGREDKVTYAEVAKDHPPLIRMVDEDGFNSLSGKEQWELISMVDRYAFFVKEAKYYAGDRGSQATGMVYSQKAKALKKEIEVRFGHVLKE